MRRVLSELARYLRVDRTTHISGQPWLAGTQSLHARLETAFAMTFEPECELSVE